MDKTATVFLSNPSLIDVVSSALTRTQVQTPRVVSHDDHDPSETYCHLDLSNKSIVGVDGEGLLTTAAGIHVLSLESNLIKTLPEELGHLRALSELNCGFNKIKSIPSSLALLPELTSLILHSNVLSSIPDAIGSIRSLRTLHVSSNSLSSLPDSICNLQHLEVLQASHNVLSSLPTNLGALSNLRVLKLGGNRLRTLPGSIKTLSNLKELYVSHNKLTDIPAGLTALKSLERLHLHHNNLQHLPLDFGALTTLLVLKLHSNSLKSLPDSIIACAALTSITLAPNPLDPAGASSFSASPLLFDAYNNALQSEPGPSLTVSRSMSIAATDAAAAAKAAGFGELSVPAGAHRPSATSAASAKTASSNLSVDSVGRAKFSPGGVSLNASNSGSIRLKKTLGLKRARSGTLSKILNPPTQDLSPRASPTPRPVASQGSGGSLLLYTSSESSNGGGATINSARGKRGNWFSRRWFKGNKDNAASPKGGMSIGSPSGTRTPSSPRGIGASDAIPPYEEWEADFQAWLTKNKIPIEKQEELSRLPVEHKWAMYSLNKSKEADQASSAAVSDPTGCANLLATPAVQNFNTVRNLVQAAHSSWINSFLAAGAVANLTQSLWTLATDHGGAANKDANTWKAQNGAIDLVHILSKMPGVLTQLSSGDTVAAITFTLDSVSRLHRLKALEILTDVSLGSSDSGYDAVIEAFDRHQEARSETVRFLPLLRILKLPKPSQAILHNTALNNSFNDPSSPARSGSPLDASFTTNAGMLTPRGGASTVAMRHLNASPGPGSGRRSMSSARSAQSNISHMGMTNDSGSDLHVEQALDVEEKFAAMCLVNALVNTPEVPQTRVALRSELGRMGLLEVMESLHSTYSEAKSLISALDLFTDEMEMDESTLSDKDLRRISFFPSRGSNLGINAMAGAGNRPVSHFWGRGSTMDFANGPPTSPSAAGSDENSLIIYVPAKRGTVTMAFQPTQKASDVIEFIRENHPEAMNDEWLDSYGLYMTPAHGNGFQGKWLSLDTPLRSYGIKGGTVNVDFKLRPFSYGVQVEDEEETRTVILDPNAPVSAAVETTLNSVFPERSPNASPGEFRGQFYELVHQEPGDTSQKLGHDVWLREERPLSTYNLNGSSGKLILRVKPKPIRIQLGDDGAGKVFRLKPTQTMSEIVGKAMEYFRLRGGASDYCLVSRRTDAPEELFDVWLADGDELGSLGLKDGAIVRLKPQPKLMPVLLSDGSASTVPLDFNVQTSFVLASLTNALRLNGHRYQLKYRGVELSGPETTLNPFATLTEQGVDVRGYLKLVAATDLELQESDRVQMDQDLWKDLLGKSGTTAVSNTEDEVETMISQSVSAALFNGPDTFGYIHPSSRGGGLKAGSVNQLIAYATLPEQDLGLSDLFLAGFLGSYRTFTSAKVLARKLAERYQVPREAIERGVDAKGVQDCVVRLLRMWISRYPEDMTPDVAETIADFTKATLAKGRHENQAKSLAASLEGFLPKEINTKARGRDRSKSEPGSQLKRFRGFSGIAGLGDAGSASTRVLAQDLWEVDEEELAAAMTEVDLEVFRRIRPAELMGGAWNKPKLRHRSPNVLLMVNRFNRTANWIASEVLLETNLRNRAKLLGKVIKLASALRDLRNYNGLMAVMSALSNSAVERLKFTRAKLPNRLVDTWDALEEVTSFGSGSKALREAMSSHEEPIVPYLGMYLTDLTYMEDSLPDEAEGGLIHWSKRVRIWNFILELLECAAGSWEELDFGDTVEDWVREMPLSLSDEDLYTLSVRREPRDASADELR